MGPDIFPMTIRGISFSSWCEIGRHFNIPGEYVYRRYVRNGLRGDDLVKPVKRNADVLDRNVTVGSRTQTVRRWLAENHIKTKTFYSRFYESHWSIVEAATVVTGITSGRNKKGRYVSYRGKTYRTIDFARLAGLSLRCVLSRLNAGWTPHQIISRPADCSVHYRERSDKGTVKSKIAILAKKYDIPYNRIINRVTRCGWSLEDALSRPLHDRTISMQRKRKNQMAELGIII